MKAALVFLVSFVLFIFATTKMYACSLDSCQVDSIEIIFVGGFVETPYSITPEEFDKGIFHDCRDTIYIVDFTEVHDIVNSIKNLPNEYIEYIDRGLNTRGKIIFYTNNSTLTLYFDTFGVLYENRPYRINEKFKKTIEYLCRERKLEPPVMAVR